MWIKKCTVIKSRGFSPALYADTSLEVSSNLQRVLMGENFGRL